MLPLEHFQPYNDSSDYKNCSCPESEKIPYSISHVHKPLPLPLKLAEAIETLLWYSPNLAESAQTFENEYLKNDKYSNAIISYFMYHSGLSHEDFSFIIENNTGISEALLAPFQGRICKRCSKIVVVQKKNESKFTCILRHMRNCLAHGRFNLIDNNTLIGFDYLNSKMDNCTAVFKLSIDSLYDFCMQLIENPSYTVSQVFQYIFLKRQGECRVYPFKTGGYNYSNLMTEEDLLFVKTREYRFRINCSRYIQSDDLQEIESINEYVPDNEDDEDFNRYVQYTDIYYCENLSVPIRAVGPNSFLLGKKGLDHMYEGNGVKRLIKLLESCNTETDSSYKS